MEKIDFHFLKKSIRFFEFSIYIFWTSFWKNRKSKTYFLKTSTFSKIWWFFSKNKIQNSPWIINIFRSSFFSWWGTDLLFRFLTVMITYQRLWRRGWSTLVQWPISRISRFSLSGNARFRTEGDPPTSKWQIYRVLRRNRLYGWIIAYYAPICI